MSTRSLEAARAFVDAINAGSIDKLAAMMTEDHVFIDSDGTKSLGKSRMVAGWSDYFAMVPDYRIIVTGEFRSEGTVVLTGEAEGTFTFDGALRPENHWKVPAAWRAVVEAGKVALWQVYVNPEPMSKILDRLRRR
jgi:ketosteroid isomerase-like protein